MNVHFDESTRPSLQGDSDSRSQENYYEDYVAEFRAIETANTLLHGRRDCWPVSPRKLCRFYRSASCQCAYGHQRGHSHACRAWKKQRGNLPWLKRYQITHILTQEHFDTGVPPSSIANIYPCLERCRKRDSNIRSEIIRVSSRLLALSLSCDQNAGILAFAFKLF